MRKFLLAFLSTIAILIQLDPNNHVYALTEDDKNTAKDFIKHISDVDLTAGIGASVSYAVDENIRAYARISGLKDKYWAYRAIDEKLIRDKDPTAIKFASSIVTLKKIVVGCFYQHDIYAPIDYYAEYTVDCIKKIINNCITNKIKWYSIKKSTQTIFGLINGITVLKAIARSILNKRDQSTQKDYYWESGGEAAYSLFADTAKQQKLATGNSVYEEILEYFGNNEQNMDNYFKHDFDCYLNQFKVLLHSEDNKAYDNDEETVIGTIKQIAYFKNGVTFSIRNTGFRPLRNLNGFDDEVYSKRQILEKWTTDEGQKDVDESFNCYFGKWVKELNCTTPIDSLIKQVNSHITRQNDKIQYNLADFEYLRIIIQYGYLTHANKQYNEGNQEILKKVSSEVATIFSEIWQELDSISEQINIAGIKTLTPKILLRVIMKMAFDVGQFEVSVSSDDKKRKDYFEKIKIFLTFIYKNAEKYKLKNIKTSDVTKLFDEFFKVTNHEEYFNTLSKLFADSKEKDFGKIADYLLKKY